MMRSQHQNMQALQATGLIVVLMAGLFIGITEPWVDDTATIENEETADAPEQSATDPQENTEDNVNASTEPAADQPTPRSEQCLDSHESLAMHIHPRLEVVISDQSITVPADLGIDTTACVQAMHLLHTHDASGKLHIEGYASFTPTADLIFEVWNISFPDDSTLQPLFDDPVNLTVTVNGLATQAAWHDIELVDGETLRIEHTG